MSGQVTHRELIEKRAGEVALRPVPEWSCCCCQGMGAKAQLASVLEKEAGGAVGARGGS